MTDRTTTAEPDLTELAPLVRVVTAALRETPLTLGTPAGIADLAATITVRVAAYVGREVLPPGPPVDRAAVLREAYEIAYTEGMRLNALEAEIGAGPYRGALAVAHLLRKAISEAQPAAEATTGEAQQTTPGLTVPALARLRAGTAALTGDAPPYDQLPDADRERYLGQAWQLLARADEEPQS
ncbi:hypothetical protein ACH4JS_34940 [Streptomyces sp. NPDC017638]|uniref:hypothetical protein n=1 Tax=Streptomyces sp. NPDC017638 TaxID=3365004 RepID=UPI0037AA08B7